MIVFSGFGIVREKGFKMKYFYIAFAFQGGYGSVFHICEIYPQLREITKTLGVSKATILNVIELTEKQYKAQNLKEGI